MMQSAGRLTNSMTLTLGGALELAGHVVRVRHRVHAAEIVTGRRDDAVDHLVLQVELNPDRRERPGLRSESVGSPVTGCASAPADGADVGSQAPDGARRRQTGRQLEDRDVAGQIEREAGARPDRRRPERWRSPGPRSRSAPARPCDSGRTEPRCRDSSPAPPRRSGAARRRRSPCVVSTSGLPSNDPAAAAADWFSTPHEPASRRLSNGTATSWVTSMTESILPSAPHQRLKSAARCAAPSTPSTTR